MYKYISRIEITISEFNFTVCFINTFINLNTVNQAFLINIEN